MPKRIQRKTSTNVQRTDLRTFKGIERALLWGWTVRCRLLADGFPAGGVEVNVEDVRLADPDLEDDSDIQVLTLEGWRTPTKVWALRPAKKLHGDDCRSTTGEHTARRLS